jgi:uncharacterized protein (TIGR00251 family)
MLRRGFYSSCRAMGKRSKAGNSCKGQPIKIESDANNLKPQTAAASPFQSTGDGCSTLVAVHLKPGAKFDAVISIGEESVSISVKSPPVEGQANSTLVSFLAELTGAKKSQVCLKSGHKSRDKIVAISGVSLSDIQSRLKSSCVK